MNIFTPSSPRKLTKAAHFAVSTPSDAKYMAAIELELNGKGFEGDVASWLRKRDDFARDVKEQLFTPAEWTHYTARQMWHVVRNLKGVKLCSKGMPTTITRPDDTEPNALLLNHWSDPELLLPWRLRIACLFSRDCETKQAHILPETTHVSHIRYGPYKERTIVSKGSETMFADESDENFMRFENACEIDPSEIDIPGKDPLRILHHEIRCCLASLMNDHHITHRSA